MSSSLVAKTRFSKYTAVFTASGQRNTPSCFACSIVRTHSTIVRFFHSALPFCSGVCGADDSCFIPRDHSIPTQTTRAYSNVRGARAIPEGLLLTHSPRSHFHELSHEITTGRSRSTAWQKPILLLYRRSTGFPPEANVLANCRSLVSPARRCPTPFETMRTLPLNPPIPTP